MLNRKEFASTAQEKVKTVKYNQLDCQAFVEWCADKAGYTFNARGSNDIYRNYTKARGLTDSFPLAIGDVVFRWRAESDKLPSRYRGDGIGDMYHIGILTNISPFEVCHSSNSKDNGKVDRFNSVAEMAKKWQYSGILLNTEDELLESSNQAAIDLLEQAIELLK